LDENGNCKNSHAWFTYLAPYKKPEIGAVVFVCGGGAGAYAAMPLAAKIMSYYFRI
tara:strand:+ start:338 stop:505 length:168 start_codon:yes stop_codon:yes gene_type:complete